MRVEVLTQAWMRVLHLCEWKHDGHPGCNVGGDGLGIPLLSTQSDIVPAAAEGMLGGIEALRPEKAQSTIACLGSEEGAMPETDTPTAWLSFCRQAALECVPWIMHQAGRDGV